MFRRCVYYYYYHIVYSMNIILHRSIRIARWKSSPNQKRQKRFTIANRWKKKVWSYFQVNLISALTHTHTHRHTKVDAATFVILHIAISAYSYWI